MHATVRNCKEELEMGDAVKKTISLPSDLAEDAERVAREEGKSLSAVIQEALRLSRGGWRRRDSEHSRRGGRPGPLASPRPRSAFGAGEEVLPRPGGAQPRSGRP